MQCETRNQEIMRQADDSRGNARMPPRVELGLLDYRCSQKRILCAHGASNARTACARGSMGRRRFN